MGTSSILKQMAEYDFTVPTDVTIIYEDNEFPLEDNTEEQENLEIDNDKKEIFVGETLVEERDCASLAKLSLNINDIQINTPILEEISRLNNTENILNNNNCKHVQLNKNHIEAGHLDNENKTDGNSDFLTLGETIANKEGNSSIETELNNHEPISQLVDTQTENMLNKLSELLSFVIQSHYLYTMKRNTSAEKDSKRKFVAAKAHYFDLSFKIVESIIIPQEHNNDFIDKFLDHTVNIANGKSYSWRCQKSHVKSLLAHLIKWTKQKRIYLNGGRITTTSLSNEYVTLKQQLASPLKPFSIPRSEPISNNSNKDNQNQTINNICIFSSGTPGSEISINISAETLRHFNKNQCLPEKTNGNNANHLLSPEPTPTNRPLVTQAPPSYEQHMYQNNYSPSRHPSPQHNPYNISQSFPHGQLYHNQTNIQVPRTQNYFDGRQLHQKHHQHMGFQQQNHQTQVQYNINSSQMNNSNNSHYTYYDNMNKQMHERPVNAQNHNPGVGHGSFNQPPFVRCHMCGKYIITRYSPYNTPPPCTLPYCSYLCKVMNNQQYKPAWSGNA